MWTEFTQSRILKAMTAFFIVFTLVFLLMWLGSRKALYYFLLEPLVLPKKSLVIYDLLLLGSSAVSILVRLSYLDSSFLVTWTLRLHYLMMGMSWLLCLLALGRFILSKIPRARSVFKDDRRTFIKKNFALAGIGSVIGATSIGAIQAIRPDIVEAKIPLEDKFKALQGLKIVQLSDVHIGPTLKKDFFDDLVQRTNKLGPNIVVITGDLIDGRVDELAKELVGMSEFKTTHGVFYVTGNHEYYWNGLEWIDFVASKGISVLENNFKEIEFNGQKISMGGVYDLKASRFVSSHTCDPKKAFEGSNVDSYKILLAHQPLSCKLAEGLGINLQLSGHTHGGQGFPWNLFVGFVQPYLKGLYTHKDMQLYVNRGTGFWGPPYRLGIPGEITLLKFV